MVEKRIYKRNRQKDTQNETCKQIPGQSGIKKQVREQTIVSLLSQIGLTAVGFLATIYFAREAPPSVVGYYYLLFSYYTLFILFSESGIGEASVKIISEGKDMDSYYSASLALRLAYLFFLFIIITVSAFLFPNSELAKTGLFYWLLLSLGADFLYSSRLYANYGQGNVNTYQIGLFLNTAIRSLFQIVAVFFGHYLFGLNGGFVFGMIATAVLTQKFIRLKITEFNSYHVKRLLSFSLWIFLVMSCYLIYQNFDVVFLGALMGEEEAAIYRIVYQFSMLGGLAAISMKAVLYPKFSAWNVKKEYSKIEYALYEGIKTSLLLAIPIFFSFVVLGNNFITLFYGGVYTLGVRSLYILTFIQIVTVFMYLGSACLNSMSHPKQSFLAIFLGIATNVVLNIPLIKIMGMEGAAVATLIAMILNASVTFLFLKKYIRIKLPIISVLKMIVSSVLMSAFLMICEKYIPTNQSILLLITVFMVGGLFYGLIMSAADKTIRETVSEILQRMKSYF